MALTFNFEKLFSPILGTIYRPVAQVFLFAQDRNRWYETWMLIDTGADYSLLPKYFSDRLGIHLKKQCKLFRTTGIGGEEKVYFLNKLRVKIGSWERDIPVGFLDKDDIPPLLGRHLFFETFETVFNRNHTVVFSA